MWTSSGGTPALFHTRVLAKATACHPEKTPRQLVVDRLHSVGLAQNMDVVQENGEMLTRFQSASSLFQSALDADAEQQRHQRVSLFPAFCQLYTDELAYERRANRRMVLPWASFSSVPEWPTSERDRTLPSRPHSTRWPIRPRHKLHATCAYWNGAHSLSNSSANCFAKVLATNLRREQPVAMPLTPPSGLESAVRRAQVRASAISCGTLAWAKLEAASNSNSSVPISSRSTRKCWYVHSPGLGEEPFGAVFKLFMNILRSIWAGVSGSHTNTSRGMAL